MQTAHVRPQFLVHRFVTPLISSTLPVKKGCLLRYKWENQNTLLSLGELIHVLCPKNATQHFTFRFNILDSRKLYIRMISYTCLYREAITSTVDLNVWVHNLIFIIPNQPIVAWTNLFSSFFSNKVVIFQYVDFAFSLHYRVSFWKCTIVLFLLFFFWNRYLSRHSCPNRTKEILKHNG